MRSRSLSFLAGGTVLVQLLVPTVGLAAQIGSAPGREVRLVQNRVCDNLEVIGSQMMNRLTEQAERLRERRGERNGRLEEARAGKLAGLARARSQQDQRHERRLRLMLERAANETEQSAVEQFSEALAAAVEQRRESVDAVMSDYLDDLEELLEGRRDSLDQVVSGLRERVEAAVVVAQEACDQDDDGVTVRQELNDAVRAAHTEFLGDWQSSISINDQVKVLLEQRNEAFRLAWVEFKAEIEAARDTLKENLSQSEDDEDDESDQPEGEEEDAEENVEVGEE